MIHFLAMLMMAAAVGLVFGVVGRDEPRERAIYGLKVFAEFTAIGLGLAWLLYFLPF